MNDNVSFSGLRLADYRVEGEILDVDILDGSDYYWNLVTGHTIREVRSARIFLTIQRPHCCNSQCLEKITSQPSANQ